MDAVLIIQAQNDLLLSASLADSRVHTCIGTIYLAINHVCISDSSQLPGMVIYFFVLVLPSQWDFEQIKSENTSVLIH